MSVISPEALIPGGILPSDHIHVIANDDTCSRCRRAIREDEVPLRCWGGRDGAFMWIYCDDCVGWDR